MNSRQFVMIGTERGEIRDYALPDVSEGKVRVVCEYAAAKHGTEVSALKGTGNRGAYDPELMVFSGRPAEQKAAERPVGNMFVGHVNVVGAGVEGLREGDRVLGYGPFREVCVVDAAGLYKMPAEMDWRSAVCLDPADFAMAAVRDGNVRIGDAVGVFGMGAIGLMAVQICKLAGAHPIIAVDPVEIRRQAATTCGADLVLDPSVCDAGLEIKKATPAPGADVCIDYSASVHALQAAIRGVAFGGTVVAGAAPGPYPAGLDLGSEAHRNRPNIVFSRACSDPNREHPRWDEPRIYGACWRLLKSGALTGAPIVDPVVPFEELVDAYPEMIRNPGSSVKLGTVYSIRES